jgi:serine kinase of HPr protein (carbohydrate metabolism regulator)
MSQPRAGEVLVHATSIIPGKACAPFGANIEHAVLLLGDSGIGKSDVALRLVAMGAQLLADDQTALFVESGRLFAGPPQGAEPWIEIRGIGIVRLPPGAPAPVLLVVQLTNEQSPRLPESESYRPDTLVIAAPPPLCRLKAFEASTPAKIAAAAVAVHTRSLLPADGTFF